MEQADKRSDAALLWREAWVKEAENLKATSLRGPYQRTEVPADAIIINSKLVFKLKTDGTHKCRVVLRGDQQPDHPIPADGTKQTLFAPTIRLGMVRIFLALLCTIGMFLNSIDVKSAFRQTPLPTDYPPTYVRFPKGTPEYLLGQLYLLICSLYGLLRDAPRLWYLFWIGLTYGPPLSCPPIPGFQSALAAYADASLGGPHTKGKSTTGVLVCHHGSPVMWTSHMQSVVALSTFESEFMATATGVQYTLYTRNAYAELHYPQIGAPTKVYSDNQPNVDAINNQSSSPRSRHIDLRFHFIIDEVLKKKIAVIHIPGTDNPSAGYLYKTTPGTKIFTIPQRSYAYCVINFDD